MADENGRTTGAGGGGMRSGVSFADRTVIERMDPGTAPPVITPAMIDPFGEAGQTGLRRSAGFVQEEFLAELRGRRGMQIYREMRDNDPVIGAFLFAIGMMIRQVEWKVEPGGDQPEDKAVADFVKGALFQDMSASWQATLTEILSMMPYGWSWLELVYKLRTGEPSGGAAASSRFTDGRVGWRKWAVRAQESLFRWGFDAQGGVQYLEQQPPPTYRVFTIPIDKSLLFRTTTERGNPEGRSILRNAYRSWYFKRRMEEIEAIGVERDLAGMPTLTTPQGLDIWNPADANAVRLKAAAEKLVRSVRRDEQEGVLIPFGWDFKLLSTGGRRNFDTSAIITRYDVRILLTVMADFLLLGHETSGSWALSKDKTDLFSYALSAICDEITTVINRHAIPRLVALNGWALENPPTVVHAEIKAPDLAGVADYVLKLAQAGVSLFPDGGLETALLQLANLPIPDAITRTEGEALVAKADPRRRDALWGAVESLEAEIRRLNPRRGTEGEPTDRPPVIREIPSALDVALKRLTTGAGAGTVTTIHQHRAKVRKEWRRDAAGRVTAIVEVPVQADGTDGPARVLATIERDNRGRIRHVIEDPGEAPTGEEA